MPVNPTDTLPVTALIAELQLLDPSTQVTSYTVRYRAGTVSGKLDYSGQRNHRERRLARLNMHERAALRPASYPRMSARRQWAVDKRLGLLDWDGVSA